MKTISRHAKAASFIRQELKKAFPSIAFSVRARTYAGGDSIDIEWTDGPTREAVIAISSKYQCGHFNAMEDMYESSNTIDGLPQVKYVFENRSYSEKILQEVFNKCKMTYSGWQDLKSIDDSSSELMNHWRYWTAKDFICARILGEKDLTNGYTE